jgi:hypothetical protein
MSNRPLPMLASTPPIECWGDSRHAVLKQVDTTGVVQEIRISQDRIDGVIRLLQQVRDDS